MQRWNIVVTIVRLVTNHVFKWVGVRCGHADWCDPLMVFFVYVLVNRRVMQTSFEIKIKKLKLFSMIYKTFHACSDLPVWVVENKFRHVHKDVELNPNFPGLRQGGFVRNFHFDHVWIQKVHHNVCNTLICERNFKRSPELFSIHLWFYG